MVAAVAQVIPKILQEKYTLFDFRTFFTQTNTILPMQPMQPLQGGIQIQH
jgi:hypothetical protein